MSEPADSDWLLDHSRRARSQDSRQYGGRDRGISCEGAREETTKRWVRPVGMPHRGTQPGVRESLMRVLVGTCIVIDICSNGTCYYEVENTLIEKRMLLIS